MIHFRDMTFCREETCARFGPCPRSLTEEVIADGIAWWGGEDFPIAMFARRPKCYEKPLEEESDYRTDYAFHGQSRIPSFGESNDD